MSSRSLLFLALARITFLRPKERLLLAELLEGAEDFLHLAKNDLEMSINRRIRSPHFRPADYLRQAQADEIYLTKRDILCTFYGDGKYPALLSEIYDPPLVLYHRGELPMDHVPHVAVVGTRRPTGQALKAAFQMGRELAQNCAVVVSGLAQGIDRAVHRGCVEADGRAVAVLGNGIDAVYPSGSRPLAGRILDRGGALVSEYPPGTLPLKHHFPARNRIISGLSQAVVVVEAPERSGALITSDFALEQGRELFVHETGLAPGTGGGSLALAEQGAMRITRAAEALRKNDHQAYGVRAATGPEPDESDENQNHSLAELMELELQNKVFLLDGEVYWRD